MSHVERVSDGRPAYRPGPDVLRRRDGLLCSSSFSSLLSPPFHVLVNEDGPRIEYQVLVDKERHTPGSPSSPSHCLLAPWT